MAERSYLYWPFLDDRHRALESDLRGWAESELAALGHEEPRDDDALDALSRTLVLKLAEGGWLRYCIPASHGGVYDTLDVRSLCLIRETLAQFNGLADFCFIMQGLGTGAI